MTALAAFGTVCLVPILKYPANPPGVGNPDTIGRRTALYFLMSMLLAAAAVLLGRRFAARWGNWNASIAAGTAFVAAIAVASAVLPAGDTIPDGFPAADLWRFRLASVGVQAMLWTSFGLLFGYLAARVLEPSGAAAASGAGTAERVSPSAS